MIVRRCVQTGDPRKVRVVHVLLNERARKRSTGVHGDRRLLIPHEPWACGPFLDARKAICETHGDPLKPVNQQPVIKSNKKLKRCITIRDRRNIISKILTIEIILPSMAQAGISAQVETKLYSINPYI
jgi:hypothetical protein